MAVGHHFPWSKALWKNFYFTELGIPIFTKNSEILYKKIKFSAACGKEPWRRRNLEVSV
jgi:hypothetical protein